MHSERVCTWSTWYLRMSAIERLDLALAVGDAGEEQQVQRQVAAALPRDSAIDASTSSQPYLHRLVVGLVEVLHRRVERDADRVEPRVEERLEPLRAGWRWC